MPRHPRTTAASISEPEPEPGTPQPEPVGPIASIELEPPNEPPAPPATATPGIVEDVLRLTKELESKRQTAIQELLAQRNRIERQLRELGHDPEPAFVKPATAAKTRTKAPAKKRTPKMPTTPGEKFCPICNTTGSHDGRAHRYQKKKKAFTADELKAYEGR